MSEELHSTPLTRDLQLGNESRLERGCESMSDQSATSPNLPITTNPEILGGTPVFLGTRVPVSSLFAYLEKNYSLDEFLDYFPSVTREAALTVLTHAERFTLEHVTA